MVVDDSEEFRTPVAAALERKGLKVITAADGEVALRLVEDEKPDLMILDMVMPVVDGMTVLRRLRARPATMNLPVILLTARDDEQSLIAASELGAYCLLKYCVTMSELYARVLARLNGARSSAAV